MSTTRKRSKQKGSSSVQDGDNECRGGGGGNDAAGGSKIQSSMKTKDGDDRGRGEQEDDSEESEKRHWQDVSRAFCLYQEFSNILISRRQEKINNLSDKAFSTLPSITTTKFDELRQRAEANQTFFDELVLFQGFQFEERIPHVLPDVNDGPPVSISQMHRNEAVLHSLVREWSSEGKEERNTTFIPILNELHRLLPVNKNNAFQNRVLVPGCGLARLPLEIAGSGYTCQANEFSVYMLMASHFMLNGLYQPDAFEIYPWIDRVSNIDKLSDVMKGVLVPDNAAIDILNKCPYADPAPVPPPSNEDEQQPLEEDGRNWLPRFSMAAGDFVSLYGKSDQNNQWDCIITCFFIDTAPVVMEYIDVIYTALRPGGYWINLGPLLYHWANSADADTPNDNRYEQSVELSWEELESVVKSIGFTFTKEIEYMNVTYAGNKSLLMWNEYKPLFFSCQKPLSAVAFSADHR